MRRLTILLAAVGALMLLPAAQAFANGTLKVNMNTAGSGSGEVSGAGGFNGSGFYEAEPLIECSGPPASGVCETTFVEEEFEPGLEAVGLHLVASPGSEILGTEGAEAAGCAEPGKMAPVSEAYCAPVSSGGGSKEFIVVFCLEGQTEEECLPPATPTALTIAKTGEGSITSNPKGIECTGAKTGAECTHKYEVNEMVTLTASPANGYAFSAWAGCTEHVGLTCKVTLSKATTVKVTFVATPSFTIEKTGSGQGKVGATGISCDENCSKAISAIKTGTSVTVKVTPAKGSEAAVFEGGTGSASGCSGESCTFTISENSSVKVKFSPIPTKTLTLFLTGPAKYKGKVTGKGTVKGLTGSAINCGSGCTLQTESFFSTDTVTLTAVAGTGYTFAGWEGGVGTCTGTTSPCTVPMSANHTLIANFK